MSRILFAWEIGQGYGHIVPFRPVAESLVARGHELTLAVRDVESVNAVCGGLPVRIVQAPICMKRYDGLPSPPLSFAEILMRFGYLDAPLLGGLFQAWIGLLDATRADALVADHAPTALLAARSRGMARATFGNAFAVPPTRHPTPSLRPWLNVPAGRFDGADAAVLAVVNRILPPEGPPLSRLCGVFEDALHLFIGTPELDPYGPRDTARYLGLPGDPGGTELPRWPDGDGPRVFAYLRTDYRHIDAMLSALAGCGARCVVTLHGATPDLLQRFGGRLHFSSALVDMNRAVADCDVVVCHSGLGTVTAALGGGKPLLLAPLVLEQLLLARNVARSGAARVVDPDLERPDIRGDLDPLLADTGYGAAAREFAARYRAPPGGSVTERAVMFIERAAAAQAASGPIS